MIFNFQKLLRSFKFAFEGLKLAFSEGNSFRIFCLFAVVVVILMLLFQVSFLEKLILILIITFTMALELINSQIEKVLDIFQPNRDSRVKIIKDIAAAAVLLVCLGAAIIGILVFLPYFKEFFLILSR